MERQRIADLSYKEVIDLDTGQRLGYVRDVEIDPESGRVTALVIPGRLRWLGLLGRDAERTVPWEQIQQLGEDLIFVRQREKVLRREVSAGQKGE